VIFFQGETADDEFRTWAGSKSWNCVLDDLLEAYQASFSSPATQEAAPALAAS
jgi:hypothetical protein